MIQLKYKDGKQHTFCKLQSGVSAMLIAGLTFYYLTSFGRTIARNPQRQFGNDR